MPKRPTRSIKQAPKSDQRIATKAGKAAGKLKHDRAAQSELTTRIRGHVSARGKRAQAKRDSR